MTWHGERIEGRPADGEREKLLAARAKIEAEIRTFAAQPVGKSQAAARFRQEDLIKLAGKIKAIDKKLGREIT
jgi:hypothetical protein